MRVSICMALTPVLVFVSGCGPNYSNYEGPTIAQIQAAKRGNAEVIKADGQNWAPHTLTPSQRLAVESAVRGALKDPDSARFGSMRSVTKNGEISICGLVNAKNSFGGYTGNQPFSAFILSKDASGQATVISIAGSDEDTRVLLIFCGNRGMNL